MKIARILLTLGISLSSSAAISQPTCNHGAGCYPFPHDYIIVDIVPILGPLPLSRIYVEEDPNLVQESNVTVAHLSDGRWRVTSSVPLVTNNCCACSNWAAPGFCYDPPPCVAEGTYSVICTEPVDHPLVTGVVHLYKGDDSVIVDTPFEDQPEAFHMTGGTGNDYFRGGRGRNWFFGWEGIDTVDYSWVTDWPLVITIDAIDNDGWDVNGDGFAEQRDNVGAQSGCNPLPCQPGHPMIQWDVERVIGGALGDVLVGFNRDNPSADLGTANTLIGGPGSDLIYGGRGNDTLVGFMEDSAGSVSDGADSLFGGEGDDTLVDVLEPAGEGYGANVFFGGPGNDVLYGGLHGDNLNGEDGDDWLHGGSFFLQNQSDAINGGAGIDTVSYEGHLYAVHVSLDGVANDGVPNQETDNVLLVENIVGSDYNDRLFGDANPNTISGRGGNDTILGSGGNDILEGGSGDDTITANDDGTWGDQIDCGPGTDTVYVDIGDSYVNCEIVHSPPICVCGSC